MKRNYYESVVIVNAALEDEQVETTISRIQEVLTTNGGEITEVERWGRKRLTYPIQKAKSGYYVILRFSAAPELLATLERAYRLDETIIRFLSVSLDKRALEALANRKEKTDEDELKTSDNSGLNKTDKKESAE